MTDIAHPTGTAPTDVRDIVWLLRALLVVSIIGVLLLAWDAVD